MNAQQAARELGVNERTVRRAIADGRLPARKVHARLFDVELDPASLACLGRHAAALRVALATLREVGYDADAEAIERRYGV